MSPTTKDQEDDVAEPRPDLIVDMAPQEVGNGSGYLPARPLPFELRQHCGIYFEEELYSQALNLLLNILSSGTVTSGPLFIPSPQHLAVAATLIVHPTTTTRAKTAEHLQVANTAIKLLRLTNTLVGPVSARFDIAFAFTRLNLLRHGGQRRPENYSQAAVDAQEGDSVPLNIGIAKAGAVWTKAEDFWHVVGWSFNCSILHPKRWRRWHLWLQLMCEILEDDWKERMKTKEENHGDSTDQTKRQKPNPLKESLIYRYITGTGSYGANRRIMRAIFADGGPTAVGQFGEIFRNELKELKKDQDQPKKREVDVNIEEDIYGDYMDKDEDDSDDTEEPQPRPKRSKRGETNTAGEATASSSGSQNSHDPAHMGGFESLALRQRLLQLLSTVSASLPDDFLPVDELYTLYIEFIRHLPIPTFQLFVTASTLPYFLPIAQATLCEMLLFRMLENKVPTSDYTLLNQAKLERHFLPYAANTPSIEDNAKVSILLESLLESLIATQMLVNTPELREAVEIGIASRGDKAQTTPAKSHSNKAVGDEWSWLIESGERLMHRVNKLV